MNKKWNLEPLRKFFDEVELPEGDVRLDQCTVITNVKRFIGSHLETLEANNGKMLFIPYGQRLSKLKNILRSKKEVIITH